MGMMINLLLSMMIIVISSCHSAAKIKIGLKRIKPEETQKYITNVDGKIVLKTISDVAYYGEIGIGTPVRTFRVLLDTGSSDLWIPGVNWPITDCMVYISSQSSTYIKNGEDVTVRYDSTRIEGFLSKDDVTIGQMIVKEQQFIEATSEADGKHTLEYILLADGVLGLGFQENSVKRSVPIWDNMATQGLIQQDIFSIWLKHYNAQDEENGVIIFGGFDQAHFKGEHTYVPVTQEVYWEFQMKAIHIGREQTDHCAEGCAAMVDTGYSTVKGPRFIINSINQAIGVHDLVTGSVDCTKISSMPTISFTIGEKTFHIFPKDYIEKSSTGECTTLFKPSIGGGDDDDDDNDDGDDDDDDGDYADADDDDDDDDNDDDDDDDDDDDGFWGTCLSEDAI